MLEICLPSVLTSILPSPPLKKKNLQKHTQREKERVRVKRKMRTAFSLEAFEMHLGDRVLTKHAHTHTTLWHLCALLCHDAAKIQNIAARSWLQSRQNHLLLFRGTEVFRLHSKGEDGVWMRGGKEGGKKFWSLHYSLR